MTVIPHIFSAQSRQKEQKGKMEILRISGFRNVNEVISDNVLKNNELAASVNVLFNETGSIGEAVLRHSLIESGRELPALIRSAAIFDENTSGQTLFVQCTDGVYIFQGASGTPQKISNFNGAEPDLSFHKLDKEQYLLANKAVKPVYINTQFPQSASDFHIMPPDISGVTYTVENTGGNLGSGYYRYLLVYVTAGEEKSGISQPLDIHGSASGGVIAGSGVRFAGLPVPADSRVQNKIIYRTEALSNNDSFMLFYKRAVLSADETTFYDTGEESSDEYLDFGDVAEIKFMPQFNCCTVHGERLFCSDLKIPSFNPFAPGLTLNSDPNIRFRAWQDSDSGGRLASEKFYKWRVVFVDKAGTESTPVDTPEFLTSTGTGENCADLQLVPYTGSGSNVYPVVKRRLYRTKGYTTPGQPGPFYLHTDQIGFSGNSFRDIKGDDELGAEYENTVSFDDKPEVIVFSEYGSYAEFSPENSFSTGESDGAVLHLSSFPGGVNIIKENAVYRLYTEGNPSGWRLVKQAGGFKSISSNSVRNSDGNLFFTDGGSIFLFDGMLKEIALNLYRSRITQGASAGAIYSPDKKCYMAAYPGTGKTTFIKTDLISGEGVVLEHPPGLIPVNNSEGLIFTGSIIGSINGNSFTDSTGVNDNEITAGFTTGFYGGDYNFRPRYLEIDCGGSENGVIGIKLSDETGKYISGVVSCGTFQDGIVRVNRSQLQEGNLHSGRKICLEIFFRGIRKIRQILIYYTKINRGRRR